MQNDASLGPADQQFSLFLHTLSGRTTSRTASEFAEFMVDTFTFLCLDAIMVMKMWSPDVASDDVSHLLYIHFASLTCICMTRSICSL